MRRTKQTHSPRTRSGSSRRRSATSRPSSRRRCASRSGSSPQSSDARLAPTSSRVRGTPSAPARRLRRESRHRLRRRAGRHLSPGKRRCRSSGFPRTAGYHLRFVFAHLRPVRLRPGGCRATLDRAPASRHPAATSGRLLPPLGRTPTAPPDSTPRVRRQSHAPPEKLSDLAA